MPRAGGLRQRRQIRRLSSFLRLFKVIFLAVVSCCFLSFLLHFRYQHRGQFLGEILRGSLAGLSHLSGPQLWTRGLIPIHDVLAFRSQPKYATQP